MNMPTKEEMKADLCLREEEHNFKRHIKRKANKNMYNRSLSKSVGHYCEVLTNIDDSHTSHQLRNYGDTDDEEDEERDFFETFNSSKVPLPQDIVDQFTAKGEKMSSSRC